MKKISLQAFEKSTQDFSITVFYETIDSLTNFKFQVLGDLSKIDFLENQTDSQFTKDLWKNTCAEIFIKTGDKDSYFEWNFGLNSRWWAAEFSSYRKMDREREDLCPLSQEKYISKKGNEMLFMLSLDLSKITPKTNIQFHPNFILKMKKGPKTHWALQHLAAQPDFHLAENFNKSLFL